MWLDLWRAEWMKVFGRRVNRFLFAFVVGIGPMSVVAICVMVAALGDTTGTHDILGYPYNLWAAARALAILGPVFAAAYVASVAGCEYTHGAWPTLLARTPSRTLVQLIKIGVLLTTLVVLVSLGIGTWLGSSTLVDVAIGGAPTEPDEITLATRGPAVSLAVIWVAMLTMIVYGSVTFLAIVLSKSAAGGLVTGVLAPLIFHIVRSRLLAWVLPNVHLQNIFAHAVGDDVLIDGMTRLLGYDVPARASGAILAAMVALCLVSAAALFTRRDVT